MVVPPSFTTTLLQDIEETSFVHDLDAVRAWVARIAATPSGPALRSTYRVLWECNQKRIPWRNRLLLCEELEAPLARLVGELNDSFHLQPLPLPRRSRKSAELAIHLHAFLIVAYKLVLEAFAGLPWMQRKTHKSAALRAAVRSLRHGEQVVVAYRMLGRSFPPDLWREAHWVYLHAHQESLLGEHVRFAGEVDARDITHAYKRVLLLGLLQPQGLPPDQFRSLMTELDDWVGVTRLMPAGRHASLEGPIFLVRADEDRPPVPSRRGGDEASCLNSTRCLVLDGAGIRERVEERMAAGDDRDALSPETLVRVRECWYAPASRRHERKRSMDAVEAIIGFEAIHRHLFMSNFAGLEGVDPDSDLRERAMQRLRGGAEDEDVWWLAESGIYFQDRGGALGRPRGGVHPDPALLRCRVMDVSVGGYRLAVPLGQTDPIHAGDLIATRLSDEHDWMLGCLRWLSTNRKGFLVMGVQVLFSAALPLVLRLSGRNLAGPPTPSLLACQGRDVPVLLLPYSRSASTKPVAEFFGKQQPVRLLDRVLSTAVVEAYRFRGGRILEDTRVPAADLEYALQLLFADERGPAGLDEPAR